VATAAAAVVAAVAVATAPRHSQAKANEKR
jgi:hypothetical protein